MFQYNKSNTVNNITFGLVNSEPPHLFFFACRKPGLKFPTSYVVVYLTCSGSKRGVIVHDVDIGENCWPVLFKLSFHNFVKNCFNQN